VILDRQVDHQFADLEQQISLAEVKFDRPSVGLKGQHVETVFLSGFGFPSKPFKNLDGKR
jgi:hypothetical protein